MIDKKQPIIIKKVVKGGHGHHGGAWKVAFADFATAMMAFFLLMWLMGGTSDEERAAISQYFENPSMTPGASPTPSTPSAVQGPGGASTSMIDLGGALDLPKEQTEQELEEEQQKLDDLMEKLKEAIESSPALSKFKDQLLLDITPEGLRIQIIDKEGRPMFDSGKADLKYHTFEILRELAPIINEAPNRISLSGHTDATPFNLEDYSNWELSADRANSARRAILDGGLRAEKVGRVVGLADSVLFDKANPRSAVNRRIAILIMNKKTEQSITIGEGASEVIKQERQDLFDQPLPEPGESRATFMFEQASESGGVKIGEGALEAMPDISQLPVSTPSNGAIDRESLTAPTPISPQPAQSSGQETEENSGDFLDVPMEYLE